MSFSGENLKNISADLLISIFTMEDTCLLPTEMADAKISQGEKSKQMKQSCVCK